MQDLSYLRSLDPESQEFEAERKRLIDEEINKVPLHRRPALWALQMELDQYRAGHTSVEFLRYITGRLEENVQNLEDVLQYLKNIRT